MEPFRIVSGKAAPMLAANIDTDVIMPKRFLKGIDRKDLDRGLFYDRRFLGTGEPNPDFVLNKAPWKGAKFLVVGPNFGCGSSREHAVWGLKQIGVRALIGTTFGGIFYDNCQRNGLLIVQLEKGQLLELSKHVSSVTGDITVDLPDQKIRVPNHDVVEFAIDPLLKEALLEGRDAIGSTLQKIDLIRAFERQHAANNPWLFDAPP